MQTIRKFFLWGSGLALLILLVGLLTTRADFWQPAAVCGSVCLAIGIGALPSLKGFQYTAWIIAAVVAGMVYPSIFLKWGSFDLRNKWLILVIVQMVMFGMGIQMSLRDFSGLASSGKGVLIGLLCHFMVMPLMGLLLTTVFHFEAEIAAGIILIGSCSSGLASNVMAFIARANLILSVTVTALSTLAAPFITPFLMKILAGTLIDIKFIPMMMEIIKIVIVPVGAALLHDYLKNASSGGLRVVKVLTLVCSLWLLSLLFGLQQYMDATLPLPALQSIEVASFFAGAIVFGYAYHRLTRQWKGLDAIMPYVSMFGIVYFTTVTTAAGRDNLLQVGFLLFISSVIHNAAGYFFGYWISRVLGLPVQSARAIAFEVGLQNGGMASGLAGSMGKLGTVGLAAAVFSPWMNISGSILANYWRRRPVGEKSPNMNEVKESVPTISTVQS